MTILNADRWLYTQLTTDPQLVTTLGSRVYVDNAPYGTQYPFAVITLVSARQVSNAFADRVMDNELWQIALWTNAQSYAVVESIADRVRDVIHKANGTGVIGAVYEGELRLSDPQGYKALVLEFRLYTQ